MIFASVRQAYQYQIDQVELSRAGSRYTAQQSKKACTAMESQSDGGKLRPCVILGPGDDDDDPSIPEDKRKPPPVALLATFGMADIKGFPRGVQHHLVPIHATGIDLGEREHLHTTPDWDGRSPQYLIAYEYNPKEHKVIRHFRSPKSERMPYGTNYNIGHETLVQLNTLCWRRTVAWQRKNEVLKKRDVKALLAWKPPKEPKDWDACTFATGASDV
ncbi:hypothetical protein PILCRDRAFT_174973 [Piloderma croceum F 1598]|uniref:Uncharacterized protein n=1 Tax=Piloderma croceum (strain F 1598) TaxID=765440 RepID=A0A0C3GHS2_PILCF|nr:hypothetical protein PILCRDRAFT_174973 [Piloderma croceum F 1598]